MPSPITTNTGSVLMPFIALPEAIDDIIMLAKPVITIIARSENVWYVPGVIFGGDGFRNDMPAVGRPFGFAARIPFHTVSVMSIIWLVSP